MKFAILESNDPYLNLAIEEYLFRYTTSDVFLLWQNEPSVVVGVNQNIFAEVDLEYLKIKNIHPVRRITGGGAVYHDLGNVNYSYITKAKSSDEIDFKSYTKPVIDALRALSVDATLSGRNDLYVDGMKFSGNAQHRECDRVLHHGTILFNADFNELSNILTVDEDKLKSKAVKSVRSRVVNLSTYLKDFSVDSFIKHISEYIIKEFSPEVIKIDITPEIDWLRKRNMSDDWIYPKRDFVSKYTLCRKKRYTFGSVELNISLRNTIITDISIFGDFFGNSAVNELAHIMKDTDIEKISDTLSCVDVSKYISGMSTSDFVELIRRG